MSTDGSYVVFDSTGALAPGAETTSAAGASSVYEYRSAGSISNGNVYLISDGNNVLNAQALGLDASGENIFFATADPLLAQDVDTQFDIYDARAGGGFPAPAMPAGCEGEACQGAPSVSPVFGTPGSAAAMGGGNLTPAPVVSPPVTETQGKAKAKPLTRGREAREGPQRVWESIAQEASCVQSTG